MLACQYLYWRIISKRDVTVADTLLQQFCLSFENLYDKDRVTPNIYLHCHLKECIIDFGPVYSFWLFSFEKYNDILGSLHNNNEDIECQIMQRFCRGNAVLNLTTDRKNLVKYLVNSLKH